jgi:hypothetical protein
MVDTVIGLNGRCGDRPYESAAAFGLLNIEYPIAGAEYRPCGGLRAAQALAPRAVPAGI